MRRKIQDSPVPTQMPVPRQPSNQSVPIPHDLTNEQIVMAAAFLDKDTRERLARRFPSDAFHGKGYPELWSGVLELTRRKLDFSIATLRQVMGAGFDEAHVQKLIGAYPTKPANLGHHIDALEWDRIRIEGARGPVMKLIQGLQDPRQSPDAIRSFARRVATAFDGAGSLRYLHEPAELVRKQMAEIQARREGRARYRFGIEGLDDDEQQEPRLIPGAAPHEMTVVCGVPGSGKSTVTALIALGLIYQERRVLYGAWEIGGGMTLELLACLSLGFSRKRLMAGALSDSEMEELRDRMDEIAGWVRFFSLPFGRATGEKTTNDRNLDIIHAYIADTGCDVVIFDLWKRCLRFTDPDAEEQALYRQQAICQETGVHGILVQQLRAKDIEARGNQRPTRESIKGSSAWFEVPDTILGIYRPALSKRVDDNVLEIDVLKQRWGQWPLAVEFDWAGEYGSVKNGRSIPYEQPTAASDSDLVDLVKIEGKRSYGGGRR